MENDLGMEIYNYERELFELIKKNIGIKPERISATASRYPDAHISFDARLPEKNRLLKDTEYLLNGTRKILHFTSLQTLYSIINEGNLRLYNLHNSNDPTEYRYAASFLEEIYKLQGFSHAEYIELLNHTKQYSYIFSCTDISNVKNIDFWDKYGDKQKGVAIEFEIINNPSEWEFFYFAKVKYSQSDIFSELSSNWESIQRKNNHITYKINLNQLLSFHKSENWAKEEEIRLLTQAPSLYWDLFKNQILSDFRTSKAGVNIEYFRLPLCDKTDNYIDKNIANSDISFH